MPRANLYLARLHGGMEIYVGASWAREAYAVLGRSWFMSSKNTQVTLNNSILGLFIARPRINSVLNSFSNHHNLEHPLNTHYEHL